MDCGRQFQESLSSVAAVLFKPAMAGILSACRAVVSRRRRCVESVLCWTSLIHRPEIGRGYPLNLSISLSGGKETNQDSLSNGE